MITEVTFADPGLYDEHPAVLEHVQAFPTCRENTISWMAATLGYQMYWAEERSGNAFHLENQIFVPSGDSEDGYEVALHEIGHALVCPQRANRNYLGNWGLQKLLDEGGQDARGVVAEIEDQADMLCIWVQLRMLGPLALVLFPPSSTDRLDNFCWGVEGHTLDIKQALGKPEKALTRVLSRGCRRVDRMVRNRDRSRHEARGAGTLILPFEVKPALPGFKPARWTTEDNRALLDWIWQSNRIFESVQEA